MNTQKKHLTGSCINAALLGAIFLLSTSAFAIDWSGVKEKKIQLYYPGQTGMEWMLNKRSHDGAARYDKRGKPCQECHKGEEKKFGPRIASGDYWEASPLPGRRSNVTVGLKVAADAENLYVRMEWKDITTSAGKKLDPDFQSKITLMIGDESSPEYIQGGCWAVCHQDAKDMPEATGKGVSKYLSVSRKDIVKKIGGGENYKSTADLSALMTEGNFLEYWQAKLNPGAAAETLSGHILEERSDKEATRVSTSAALSGGKWVVEFTRALQASSQDEKSILAGKPVTFGIALHDQYTNGRYHLVSFEYKMAFEAGSDIKIMKF